MAEHKFLGVCLIGAKQGGGGVEPIAVFVNQPLSAPLGISFDFFPDFHSVKQYDTPLECKMQLWLTVFT